MPEIIETLVLKPEQSPYFTVNKDVLSVDLREPGGDATDCILFGADGKAVFQENDNFRVLSCGFILPESFVMAKASAGAPYQNPQLKLFGRKGQTLSIFTIPQWGSDGIGIIIPMENFELCIDVYCPVNTLYNNPFELLAQWLTFDAWPQVSMVGVPAALDQTVQTVTVFIKVLHNFPLQTWVPPVEPLVADFDYEVVPV